MTAVGSAAPVLPARPRRRAGGGPRVHPVAWWVWALLVCVTATLVLDVTVLLVLGAAVVLVSVACRAPGARTIVPYLLLAASILLVRTLVRVILPSAPSGTVLVDLPEWTIGSVTLFGPVTTGALASGLAVGIQLAVLVVTVGAATTLADPVELLRYAPRAFTGVATALVVAVGVFGRLAGVAAAVRDARRLRGGGGLRAVVVPVLARTLEDSLALGDALEVRGYGSVRPGPTAATPARRLAQGALTLGAVACVGLAAFALFDASAPGWAVAAFLGAAVVSGAVAARVLPVAARTVHRPAPWTLRSSVVVGTGVLAAGVVLASAPVTQPTWLALGAALVPLGALSVGMPPAPRTSGTADPRTVRARAARGEPSARTEGAA
ncbi:energy-coupling factor transport system permease protein [Sediminihabitans luteus]|uniref:Energy-coupling factor transport system permease protein n=1 Tax=Sediminihabitans luteus TaxID=1138585 RepID=A0A2M9CQ62_9CELL|nr:hypothetical protein [Sediminihabitans luteus]PJJ74070.1 energy-coupling factor transport system permease protein [Sediminihabitans luteus]GII98015.1 hypothetical protein Slu03_03930 [Sediminihabitans luteus]